MSHAGRTRSPINTPARRRLAPALGLWAVLVSLPVMTVSAAGDAGSEPNAISNTGVEIEVRLGRYTVRAAHASVSDLLHAIGNAAGFKVRIFGHLDATKNTWSYRDVPLAKLVRDLSRGYSTVMLYRAATAGDAAERLSEFWIYAPDAITQDQLADITIVSDMQDSRHAKPAGTKPQQDRKIQQIARLEGIAEHTVIDTLSQTLALEADPVVRRRAVAALADIGGTEVLAALEAGLGDRDPKVRSDVAQALGGITQARAIWALGQILFTDQDPAVRLVAVRALARHASPAARTFVENAQRDRSAEVREGARLALQQWPEASN